jgi:dTDP-4-dehydrorhamnose 3,5-epimerase
VRVIEEPLPGVKLLAPDVYEDHRGFFMESYNRRTFATLDITDEFVQDNHSRSVRGVLRGLHYQLRHPQAKLVRATRGQVFDVVVDIRRGSPTFGRWVGAELSEKNRRQLYAPAGFAHGFLVLSESAEFQYKCSDFYSAADERGLPWDDPGLGILWPLDEMVPVLSGRDTRWHPLADAAPEDLPEYRP